MTFPFRMRDVRMNFLYASSWMAEHDDPGAVMHYRQTHYFSTRDVLLNRNHSLARTVLMRYKPLRHNKSTTSSIGTSTRSVVNFIPTKERCYL